MSRLLTSSIGLVLATSLVACGQSEPIEAPAEATTPASPVAFELETVATGFSFPWGIAFLPEGGFLVSERDGELSYVAPGSEEAVDITGLPDVYVAGQGGVFDVVLDPAFEDNRFIYLSYAKGSAAANSTAIYRARLSEDMTALEEGEDVFVAESLRATPAHFGGRMTFLPDGTLVLTLGEGFRYMAEAQNPQSDLGTVVRINSDGTIPADNPFADGAEGLPHVWSYGHRNVQGVVFDEATDTLYTVEHGPMGGDEINVDIAGANYGWPEVTYGVNYDGSIITTQTEAEGMESPMLYWVPSIAPGGMEVYTGDVYPDWQGDLFVAALAGMKVQRVDMDGSELVGQEALFDDFGSRFRQIAQGPDGYLYLLSDEYNGSVYRIVIAD